MVRMMMVARVTAEVGVTVQGPQGLLVAMASSLVRFGLGVAGVLFVGIWMDAEKRICLLHVYFLCFFHRNSIISQLVDK